MTYTDVFSGDTINPSNTNLTILDLTEDVDLYWPLEAKPNVPVVSSIIQIASSDAAWTVSMPDATRGSEGAVILFDNTTSEVIAVTDTEGTQITTLPASTQWAVYLDDNSTVAGSWRAVQFAAATSSANASSLAGYGLKAIGSTLNQKINATSFVLAFTASAIDRARYYNFSGSGAGIAITLPLSATVGSDWFFYVRNSGANALGVTPQGADTINGEGNLSLSPGDSCIVISDGTSFSTVGFGQSGEYAFDYVVVDISGGTDYTLSGTELNRIAYELIGVLTTDVNVVVPAVAQQYWVYDNTTAGAFVATIGTSTQVTPVALSRGDRAILYCDGSDVVAAFTTSYSGTVNGGTF